MTWLEFSCFCVISVQRAVMLLHCLQYIIISSCCCLTCLSSYQCAYSLGIFVNTWYNSLYSFFLLKWVECLFLFIFVHLHKVITCTKHWTIHTRNVFQLKVNCLLSPYSWDSFIQDDLWVWMWSECYYR